MSAQGDGFDRRSFLVLVLQALLLSLFPWLRRPDALPMVEKVAEQVVERAIFKGGTMRITMSIKGFEIPGDLWDTLQDGDLEALGVKRG